MNVKIFCIACLILLSNKVYCQSKDEYSSISDKSFIIFIDKFYTITEFPFNRRKSEQYLVENILYKGPGITFEEEKKYLNKSNQDFYIEVLDFGEDGNLVSKKKEEKYVFKGQKIFFNNYILLITEESPDKQTIRGDETNDTLFYCLRIFNPNANMVDSMIIGGYFDKVNDYKDVVFFNKHQFRIFNYYCNNENVIKGRIIDKSKPLTLLSTTDYEINMETGKISCVGNTSKDLKLFNIVSHYQQNGIQDDPLNEY